MIWPPATSSVTPVIQEELSEARKSTAWATSAGEPSSSRGHGDDRAAAPLDHSRQEAPQREERGGEVAVDRGAPLVRRDLGRGPRRRAAAADEGGEHVDGPVRALCSSNR